MGTRLILSLAVSLLICAIAYGDDEAGNGRYRRFSGHHMDFGPHPMVPKLQYFGQFFCSASVVAEKALLTAAHCVSGRWAGGLKAAIGDPVKAVLSAVDIAIHPEYNSLTYENDVALIKLSESVPRIKNSYMVTLEKSPVVDYGNGTPLALYPDIPFGSPNQGVVRQTTFNKTVISKTECVNLWSKSFSVSSLKGQSCLVNANQENQGRYKSDGAPVMLRDHSDRRQVGVISASDCGYRPEIFTEIPKVYDWITQTMDEFEHEAKRTHGQPQLQQEEINFYRKIPAIPVNRTEAKYLVSIVDATTRGIMKCVGAILDNDLIVTTIRDCADAGKSNILVKIESFRTGKSEDSYYTVSGLGKHKKYDASDRMTRFNLAVLHLQQKIEFNEYVDKVQVAEKTPSFSSSAYIYGYSLSKKAKKLGLVVSHNQECEFSYFRETINEPGRICAKSRYGLCSLYNPYGSPLIVNGTLVGLMSMQKDDCADYRAPVVFTDLTMDKNKEAVEHWLHYDWHDGGDL
ncbi:hypothetical protein QAD02_009337 [Eretmocerus hayati]|uniref:Uncharacterized protein n=1 Tax=Eretmocerus hayati TaxID=131215 RepID=A0ACC2N8Z2_9HYME|nr:hypothetical protein QAD02_009337 [Eretmocerus hayati]